MIKKIGIMGGTFNPIHFGHLLLAEQTRESLDLDEVIFIPSGNPYMKRASDVLDKKIRMEMTSLAIEGHPYFRSSSIEVNQEGPSYTCETLAALKKENPSCNYYFIVGADSLCSMETWKNPEQIFQNCIVAAAVRGDKTKQKIQKIAEELIYKYQADIRILPSRFVDISSSEIRERIRHGKSVRYMLPERVLEYIHTHQLYQNIQMIGGCQ